MTYINVKIINLYRESLQRAPGGPGPAVRLRHSPRGGKNDNK